MGPAVGGDGGRGRVSMNNVWSAGGEDARSAHCSTTLAYTREQLCCFG